MRIKNWKSYQSYKDRKPPWIRFHRTIVDNYQFQTMSADARALLPMFWLLACEDKDPTSGNIPFNVEEISFRLRQRIELITDVLEELERAEFIECIESVTKPYKDSNQTVTPETETETETEAETETTLSPPKPVTDLSHQKIPPCPHLKIVDQYNKILSHKLPSVNPKLWTDARRKPLTTRWKEVADRQNLAWWTNFFETVASSPFLIGEKTDWRANLDWLIKQGNMIKVLEGKYKDHGSSQKKMEPRNVREVQAIQGSEIARILNEEAERDLSTTPTGEESGVLLEHTIQ